MLPQEIINEENLSNSVVDFLRRWPHQHVATLRELLVDSAVVREMNESLPKGVPICQWIRRRLQGEIHITEDLRIHVVGKSHVARMIVERYKSMAVQNS